MPVGGLATLLLCVAAAAAAATLPRPSVHGPEPGHTGGFGEPTCRACHFDGPETTSDADVAIDGLPTSWTPGTRYPITVVLRGAALRRGGFQLAVRHATGEDAGRQAGVLSGDSGRVSITVAGGVSYGHHVRESTAPTAPGVVRWELAWTAPVEGAGLVAFHVAANAANDDDSELGDLIVTAADTIAAPSQ
jgi:hypothetical protein